MAENASLKITEAEEAVAAEAAAGGPNGSGTPGRAKKRSGSFRLSPARESPGTSGSTSSSPRIGRVR